MDEEEAIAITTLADEIKRLRVLVRDAYNAGFDEGTREETTIRGGIPWSESRFSKIVSKDGSE